MESIEKLRKALKECTNKSGVEPNVFDTYWITAAACDKYIDAIECEIAERYMLLPMDADGVPIRVGSKVVCSDGITRTVMAVTDDGACLDTIEHYGRLRLHVVKPRTIEDVLTDFGNEIACQGHQVGLTGHEIIMKYADELRSIGVRE